MGRSRRYDALVLWVGLLVVWVVFVGRATVAELAIGILVCGAAAFLFGRFLAAYALSRLAAGVLVSAAFLPLFAWEILRASWRLAVCTLSPRPRFRQGIVRFPVRLARLPAVTALAVMITLTPGTLALDYDGQAGDLFLHCLEVPDGPARPDSLVRLESWARWVAE